jgi:hypothetical protein
MITASSYISYPWQHGIVERGNRDVQLLETMLMEFKWNQNEDYVFSRWWIFEFDVVYTMLAPQLI